MSYVLGFFIGVVIGVVIAAFFGGKAQTEIEKELIGIRAAFSSHLASLEKATQTLEGEAVVKVKAAIVRLREAFRL